MAMSEQLLAQLRPANTTAASLYSPAAAGNTIIKSIIVCNTSAATATFRIFLDDDGTTYDETTAHYWDHTLASDTTLQIDTYWAMNNTAGNLAVRTDTNNAFTFTAYGVVIT